MSKREIKMDWEQYKQWMRQIIFDVRKALVEAFDRVPKKAGEGR